MMQILGAAGPDEDGLLDAIFAYDPSFMTDAGVVLLRPGKTLRLPEVALAERAYAEGAPRQVESSRVPGGLVIEERVSSKEVTSPMRSAPRAPATIPPPAPPSLPPLPRSVAPPSAWVSPPSMPPSRPPMITVAAPDLALDLISREANYASIPPPVGADAQTKRHRAVPTTTTRALGASYSPMRT